MISVAFEHDVIQFREIGEHFISDLLVFGADMTRVLNQPVKHLTELVQTLNGRCRMLCVFPTAAHHNLAGTLQLLNITFHFFGGLLGAIGQRAYLIGHNGETAAMLTRAGRLNGRIQRQQVGLLRDVLDQRHHITDLIDRLVQLFSLLLAMLSLVLHFVHHANDFSGVLTHLINHLAGLIV